MDVAFVGEFSDSEEVFRAIEGDAASFGLQKDAGVPLEKTYCRRVVESRLPNVIHDAKGHEELRHLEVTRDADIGSYVGVPLRFSDGSLYGMLCCLSHAPDPSLGERDVKFMRILGRLVADQLERQEVERENWRLKAEATGVRALLAALQARDGYTGEHSEAVVALSGAVARALRLPAREIVEVEQVALLHDIGKVGVPDAILNKRGSLDEREWEVMRGHPGIGTRIVEAIDSLAHLGPAIRAEHERWDGRGYPDGLSGEEIPLASRIVFACDAYHAMISERPYRRAMSDDEARSELERHAGSQFCPRSAQTLLAVLGSSQG